jgi:hypothetical protein
LTPAAKTRDLSGALARAGGRGRLVSLASPGAAGVVMWLSRQICFVGLQKSTLRLGRGLISMERESRLGQGHQPAMAYGVAANALSLLPLSTA